MKYFLLIILSNTLLFSCVSESEKNETAVINNIKTTLEITDLNKKLEKDVVIEKLTVGTELPQRQHTATNVSLFMYNAAVWLSLIHI